MAGAADDQMVMDGDAELLGRVGDFARHVDVGARRRRVAAGVIVDLPSKYTYQFEIPK